MLNKIIAKAAFGLLVLGSFVTSAAIGGNTESRSSGKIFLPIPYPVLISSGGFAPTLAIDYGNFTSKWFEGTPDVQVIELVLSNTHTTNYLTLADSLVISLTSNHVSLVKANKVYQIAPRESVLVQVSVTNKPSVTQGASRSANLTLTYGTKYGPAITTSKVINGMAGFADYIADSNNLSYHSNPDWFHEIKYGIFIHWGIYSVPAFGNVGWQEDYSEWY